MRSYGADVVIARGDLFCNQVRAQVPAGVDALFDTALVGRNSFPAIGTVGRTSPCAVEQIAKAMIATSLVTPAQSAVYHYPEMMALNRARP